MLSEINQILTGKEKRQGVVILLADLLIAVLDIAFLGVLMLLVNRQAPGHAAVSRFPVILQASGLSVPLFLLLYLLKNILAYAAGASTQRFFAEISTRLSREQLRAFFNGGSDNFNHTDASVFVRRISQQPIEFSTYILANLQSVISQSMLAVFAIAAVLLYHPGLFLILLLLLLPPVAAVGLVLKRKLREVRSGTKRASENVLQYLQESLGGYVEANIYRKTDFFNRRFGTAARQLNRHIARQQTLQALPPRLLEVAAIAGFFLLAFIVQNRAGEPAIDWFTLAVFLGAIYKILPATVRIINGTGQMKTYSFVLNDLLPHTFALGGASNSSSHDLRGVEARHLRFRHPNAKKELRAAFHLRPGDLVAVTGRSGSGKTSLLQMLAGLLKPDQGTVTMHRHIQGATSPLPGDSGVAYVKQQPFLLHDSLRKNVSLANEADEDLVKMDRVLRCCGLGSLISGHPDGLEQLITENGRNVSGGQRQRIMLARALYHEPQLLLLDEPFSQLDEAAETEMMQLLGTLAATGMIIVIATHSPAAAAGCHSIIALDEPAYA